MTGTKGSRVRADRARTAVGLVSTGALLMLVGAGCSTDTADPRPVVTALADGLVEGDVSGVPLQGTSPQSATEQLEAITTGLGEVAPSIVVGEVVVGEEDPKQGNAELQYTWDLGPGEGPDWTYTTNVDLALVEEDWKITWRPDAVAPDLQDGEVLTLRRAPAPRGQILGARDEVLVEDRPVLRLGLDKVQAEPDEQQASARQIATILNLDAGSYAQLVRDAGPESFVEALVVRTQDPGVDLEEFAAIPGARSIEGTLPLAPTREFARSVLGAVGPATAEIIEASDGQLQSGDLAGLSGLQNKYDGQLRGSPQLEVLARREGPDQEERVMFTRQPVPGEDLGTTLDAEAQQVAEQVLADVEGPSAIVAIRPSTGEVLALADGAGSQGQPTATLGQYAPGSVFKVVSSLALLRSGLTPESSVECPETVNVDGRSFRNFPDYPADSNGTIDLREAIAQSCNTALIGLRDQAPPAELVDAAASLGLGEEKDLGFPAYLGNVPADSTSTDHAASMIGQARIEASPLAMAAVAASVAAGATVTPRLLDEPPAIDTPSNPLTPEEASALRDLMRAVVTDGGASFLQDVPGEPVLAKTGTAQYGDSDQLANHAWMIAIQADLAVTVFVETGEYGSTTAGPLLEEFLTGLK